jgi:hypothetical protein
MRRRTSVTLSNENGLSRFRACRYSCPPASDRLRALTAERRPLLDPGEPHLLTVR